MATIYQDERITLTDRLVAWAARQPWIPIVLIWVVSSSLAFSLSQAEWVRLYTGYVNAIWLGLLCGVGLARSRFKGVLALAYSVCLSFVWAGDLVGGILQAAWTMPRYAVWAMHMRLEIFAVRVGTWGTSLTEKGAVRDTGFFVLLASVVIWNACAWLIWCVMRRRRALDGLLPIAFLLAINIHLRGQSALVLAIFVLAGSLLVAYVGYTAQHFDWERRRVDYPTEVGVTWGFSAIGMACLIFVAVQTAALVGTPSGWRALGDYLHGLQQHVSEIADHFFHDVNSSRAVTPVASSAGVTAGPPSPAGVAPSISVAVAAFPPDLQLIGNVPDQSPATVMWVTTSDPTPFPVDDIPIQPAAPPPQHYWRTSLFATYTGAGWELLQFPDKTETVVSGTIPAGRYPLLQHFEIVALYADHLFAANLPVTATAIVSPTAVMSPTAVASPTAAISPTATMSATVTPTLVPSPTATMTPTPTPLPSATRPPQAPVTATPVVSLTMTPGAPVTPTTAVTATEPITAAVAVTPVVSLTMTPGAPVTPTTAVSATEPITAGVAVTPEIGVQFSPLGDSAVVEGAASNYEVLSWVTNATVSQLEGAGTDYPEEITRIYLQLPASLPQRVRDLADQITAKATTPYAKALLLQDYLRTNYTYTLNVPPPPSGQDGVDYFLFEAPGGFCSYYASAMAVMLRAEGVPARVATGYAMGEYDFTRQAYRVSGAMAHAWVEVYFPVYGWVEFEPTAVRSNFSRAAGEAPKPAAQAGAAWRALSLSMRINWSLLLGIFGVTLLVTVIVGVVRVARSLEPGWTTPRGQARMLYRQIRGALIYAGFTALENMTPSEFMTAHRAPLAARPAVFLALSEATQLYLQATFSGRPPAPAQTGRVRRLWLRASLDWFRLWLRARRRTPRK